MIDLLLKITEMTRLVLTVPDLVNNFLVRDIILHRSIYSIYSVVVLKLPCMYRWWIC